MSRHVGRHRSPRPSATEVLRRPAVLSSAAIATVSMGVTGYASATGAIGTGHAATPAQALARPQAPATADTAADVAAKAQLVRRVAAARAGVTSRSLAQRAQITATARANQVSAGKSAAGVLAAKKAAAKLAAAKKAAVAAKSVAATKTSSPTSTAPTATTSVTSGDPKTIAASMLGSYGWSSSQMGCLVSLWTRESGWNYRAENSGSGAYGIPQSLPGSKMASAGADWRTNPATQIRWGLTYIKGSYGSPCGAWGHSQATGWY